MAIFPQILVLALSLVVPAAVAQFPDDDSPVMEVIHLQYTPLSDVVGLVSEVYSNELETITGSEATNSLILRGSRESVLNARALVERVDVPAEQSSDRVTEFISVRTYPVFELVPLVEQVIGTSLEREVGSVAIDEYNRRLVVTAPKSAVDAAREFVAKLDQPRQLLTIHVTFLRGDIGAGTGKSAGSLPESLKQVAETLRENGLSNPTLMAPFTIKTQAGKDFGSISNLEVRTPGAKNNEVLKFEVKGSVRTLTDGEQVELDFESSMSGHVEMGDEGSMSPYFELQTTLAVPMGRYVLLALAPSSTLSGNAIALVLRVTRE